MTREDIGRVAIGAPALQQVVVVSLPDCLLVKQWARGDEVDADASAVHLGNLFRVAQDSLRGIALRGAELLTVETTDAVVMIVGLTAEAAAGFIFDKSAPLGLLRVQARQLATHLESMVPSLEPSRDLSQDLTMRPSIPPAPPPPAAPPPVAIAPSAPPRPTVVPPVAPPPFPAPPTATPAPLSTAARASSTGLPAEDPKEARPRAVRLLDFFRRYAPDPHASMLRLSLRTGLSLEALGRPEGLSEDQVESVANAVRDILGQEQVGV